MGKPTTSLTKKTAGKSAAKPAAASKENAPETPPAATTKTPAPKAKRVRKPAPAKTEKPAAVTARRTTTATKTSRKSKSIATTPAYTNDDIALRAYFIAQKRERLGLHGSPESDWLEAERQLREAVTR